MKTGLEKSGYEAFVTKQGGTVSGDSPVLKSVDEIAREVIDGYWGNGDERKRRLVAAGYDYPAVQNRVNEILAGK